MKVINVINGYNKQYDIERVIIINGHKVLCAVTLTEFLDAYHSKVDHYPCDLAKEYAAMEVIGRDVFNGRLLFLFVSDDNE